MKKNFKYAMMMATALVLGFSSCSSDNDPIEGGGSHVEEGLPTKAEIRISASATYAPQGDMEANDKGESKVKDVAILMYKNNGQIENAWIKSGNAITFETSSNSYKVESIEAKSGVKSIFVIVNLPATNAYTADLLKATFSKVGDLSTLRQELALADVTNPEGFTMTSEIKKETLKPDETTTVDLDIARISAKFSVMNPSGEIDKSELTDGTIDGDLMFAVGQINNYAFLAQNVLNGKVVDPNFEGDGKGVENNDLTGMPKAADYILFNDNSSDDATIQAFANVKYALENTNPEPAKRGDVTYVAISGKFVPNKVMQKNAQGVWKETGTAADLTEGTFVRVKDKNQNNRFFVDETNAYEWAKKEFELTYAPGSDDETNWKIKYVNTYDKGMTYYTVYPEKENNVNIYRNSYHNIEVKRIIGLGDPQPGPQERPDTEDPDTDTPVVSQPANIIVNITPLDWKFYTESVDLDAQE